MRSSSARSTIGAHSSVWPGAVLRGDGGEIVDRRAARACRTTRCCTRPRAWPTVVGDGCVLGHLIHLEGCTIENDVLIGNAAMVLHRVRDPSGRVVAANSVVLPDVDVPIGRARRRNAGGRQTRTRPSGRNPTAAPRPTSTASSCTARRCADWTDMGARSFVVTVAVDDVEIAADRLWQAGARGIEERADGTGVSSCGRWSATTTRRSPRGVDARRPMAVANRGPDAEWPETWREHARPMVIGER